MGRLDNKIAIVTGAAQGIGMGIALAMAAEGADVIVCDLTEQIEKSRAVADEIQAKGRQGIAVACDVTDEVQVNTMVKRAVSKFGRVDILVNNAGIQRRALVVDMSTELWDRTLAINVRGTFLATRAVLPHMLERGSGKIINISSDSGKVGFPTGAAYCASKWAVLGFTRSVALEVREENININAICPGKTLTPMTSGRVTPEGDPVDTSDWMHPADVAEVAVFLASEEAKAIYGAAIDVWGKKGG